MGFFILFRSPPAFPGDLYFVGNQHHFRGKSPLILGGQFSRRSQHLHRGKSELINTNRQQVFFGVDQAGKIRVFGVNLRSRISELIQAKTFFVFARFFRFQSRFCLESRFFVLQVFTFSLFCVFLHQSPLLCVFFRLPLLFQNSPQGNSPSSSVTGSPST